MTIDARKAVSYRKMVPVLLLLVHVVLLFQLQLQKSHELKLGLPSTPISVAQLVDMSVNLPAFLAGMYAAKFWDHSSTARLFVFYFATPLIPILWYWVCGVIERRASKTSSSPALAWKMFRGIFGTLSIFMFLICLTFAMTRSGDQVREKHWLGAAGAVWFGLFAFSSFWPGVRKSRITSSSEELAVGSPLTHSLTGQEQRVARIGDRAVSAVLDGILILPIFVGLLGLTAYWYHIPADESGSIKLVGGPALFVMFFSTVLWCAYYFFAEWQLGRTLGKEVMAIEVIASSGEKCGARRAFVRNFLRPIDAIGFYFVGFLIAVFSAANQRVGDRVAGTIVKENPSAKRRVAIVVWFVALILLSAGSFASSRFASR